MGCVMGPIKPVRCPLCLPPDGGPGLFVVLRICLVSELSQSSPWFFIKAILKAAF